MIRELKFKIGDKVEVIGNELDSHFFSVGDVCEVIEVEMGTHQEYLIESLKDEERWWVTEKDIIKLVRED